MKYQTRDKLKATTMSVREATYEYLVAEAARTKRTPQGQLELMTEMFQLVIDEFHNDDPAFIKAELARLRKLIKPVP